MAAHGPPDQAAVFESVHGSSYLHQLGLGNGDKLSGKISTKRGLSLRRWHATNIVQCFSSAFPSQDEELTPTITIGRTQLLSFGCDVWQQAGNHS